MNEEHLLSAPLSLREGLAPQSQIPQVGMLPWDRKRNKTFG